VTAADVWSALIVVERASPESAERLARALAPEASREVPRARARIGRPSESVVELRITAGDTGALRAALNTYLGWVELTAATESILSAGEK
jgi:tRNA threonylcarbamoyladenosine modification (KEOPS) complex  Pcc1 subunit